MKYGYSHDSKLIKQQVQREQVLIAIVTSDPYPFPCLSIHVSLFLAHTPTNLTLCAAHKYLGSNFQYENHLSTDAKNLADFSLQSV